MLPDHGQAVVLDVDTLFLEVRRLMGRLHCEDILYVVHFTRTPAVRRQDPFALWDLFFDPAVFNGTTVYAAASEGNQVRLNHPTEPTDPPPA